MLKKFMTKEFLIFICVGVINTFNGTFLSIVYSKFFNPNISFMLGYVTSLSINYVLNSIITFKEPLSFKKGIKFAMSYIPNFIIQNSVVFVVHNLLHFHEFIGYATAAVFGVPITFLVLKAFTFTKDNTKKETAEN